MPKVQLNTTFNNPLLKTADQVAFRDTFNRADGVLTGQLTPIGGKAWITRSDGSSAVQSAVVRSNQAGILSDTAGALLLAVIDAATANGVYELDFAYAAAGVTNTQIFIPFRVSTSNNYLELTVTNGKWTLRKRVSGTYIAITVSAVDAVVGQRIKFVLSGASIRIYINGILAIDVVETDQQANTMFGIGNRILAASAPGLRWDNISFTIPGT